MAQKKNYWYVLVMTNQGPRFVTKIDYSTKTAYWDELEKPIEMDKSRAQDLTIGLNLNCNYSFAVCQPFEIDSQPYRYNLGHFEWKYKEEKEDE